MVKTIFIPGIFSYQIKGPVQSMNYIFLSCCLAEYHQFPQTSQFIVISLDYPPELEKKTLLLKIPPK